MLDHKRGCSLQMWLTQEAWLWRPHIKALFAEAGDEPAKIWDTFIVLTNVAVEWSPIIFCVETQTAFYQLDIIQQHLIGCCHPLPSPTLNTGGYVKAKTSLHFWSPWGHIWFESGFSFGSNPPISCYCPWKRECDSVASPGCNGLICTLLCTVEGRGNQWYLGADSSSLMIASCSYAKHLYSC